jgi:hypothetical protein
MLSKKAVIAIAVCVGVVFCVTVGLLLAHFLIWQPVKLAARMAAMTSTQIIRADTYTQIPDRKYVTDVVWTSSSSITTTTATTTTTNVMNAMNAMSATSATSATSAMNATTSTTTTTATTAITGKQTDGNNTNKTTAFLVTLLDENTLEELDSQMVPSNTRFVSLTSSLNNVPPYTVRLQEFIDGVEAPYVVSKVTTVIGSNGGICSTPTDCSNGSTCDNITGRCVCDARVPVDRLFIMCFTNGTVVAWHDYRTAEQKATVMFECNLYHKGIMVGNQQNVINANVMFDFMCTDVNDLTAEARSILNCGSTVKWSFHIGARYKLSYPNARCSSNCICAFGYCATSRFGCPYPQVDGLTFHQDGTNISVSTTFVSTADVEQKWRLTLQTLEVPGKPQSSVKMEPIVQLVRLLPKNITRTVFALPVQDHFVDPTQLAIKFENMGAIVDSPCAQPMIISRLDSCSYGSIYPFSNLAIELKPARTNEIIISVAATFIPSDQLKNTARAASLDTAANIENVETAEMDEMDEMDEMVETVVIVEEAENNNLRIAEYNEDDNQEQQPLDAVVDVAVVDVVDDWSIMYHIIEFFYMNKFIGTVVLKRHLSNVELVVKDVPCNDPSAIRAILKTVSPCPEPTAMTLDVGFIVTACPIETAKAIKADQLQVQQMYFVGDTGVVVTTWVGWSPLLTTATLLYRGRDIETLKPPDPNEGSVTFYTDFIAPGVYIDVRDLSVRFTNTKSQKTVTKWVYQCVSTALLRPSQEVSKYLAMLAPTEDTWWSFQVQPAQTAFDFAEIVVLTNTDRPVSELVATYYVFGNVIGVDDVQEERESYFVLPYRFRDCDNAIARGIFAEFRTLGACDTTIRNKQTRLACGKKKAQFDTRSPELANIVQNIFNTVDTQPGNALPTTGNNGSNIVDISRPIIT